MMTKYIVVTVYEHDQKTAIETDNNMVIVDIVVQFLKDRTDNSRLVIDIGEKPYYEQIPHFNWKHLKAAYYRC